MRKRRRGRKGPRNGSCGSVLHVDAEEVAGAGTADKQEPAAHVCGQGRKGLGAIHGRSRERGEVAVRGKPVDLGAQGEEDDARLWVHGDAAGRGGVGERGGEEEAMGARGAEVESGDGTGGRYYEATAAVVNGDCRGTGGRDRFGDAGVRYG